MTVEPCSDRISVLMKRDTRKQSAPFHPPPPNPTIYGHREKMAVSEELLWLEIRLERGWGQTRLRSEISSWKR